MVCRLIQYSSQIAEKFSFYQHIPLCYHRRSDVAHCWLARRAELTGMGGAEVLTMPSGSRRWNPRTKTDAAETAHDANRPEGSHQLASTPSSVTLNTLPQLLIRSVLVLMVTTRRERPRGPRAASDVARVPSRAAPASCNVFFLSA
jgi:hypothetical protein